MQTKIMQALPESQNSSAIVSAESTYSWLVAIVSLLLIALGSGGYLVVMVNLKPIAAEFGWPRQILGMAYGLALLGMGLGGIWLGRWSDRIGVFRLTLCGALMIAAGVYIAGLSTEQWSFLLTHAVLIGVLGNGALFVPLLGNIARWFDRRLGLAVAIVVTGQSLGGAMWPPVLYYLTETLGWRANYYAIALIALFVMAPLTLLLRYPPPTARLPMRRRQTVTSNDGRVVGWPAGMVQLILCTAIVGCCVAMAMPMVHLVAYASDLGHPPARAAELLSVLLGCSVLSRLIWGWVSDHIGGLLTLLIGSAAQALMLALFIFTEGLAALYAGAALFGLAFGGIIPSYTVIVHELFPASQVGRRVGPIVFFGTVGMALGGWLGGLIFDLFGSYQRAFAIGVAFNLGNLILVGALFWQSLKDANAHMAGKSLS